MPNGSEEASVVRATTLQGHMMPVGADASTEQGFRDWVGSVHPVFVEMKLADLLVEMGYESYDRMAVVASIDEETLRESLGSNEVTRPCSCSRLAPCTRRWEYVRLPRWRA